MRCARHRGRGARRRRRPAGRLQCLLGVLCLLTLVVLASASRRLGLYEQEFVFTRLRAAWLPRAVVLSAAAGLLVFALADPDARIAARNVERAALTGDLDAAYLSQLSADAVPSLLELPPAQRACALAGRGRLEADPPADWNLSRARARDLLAGVPATPCVPVG